MTLDTLDLVSQAWDGLSQDTGLKEQLLFHGDTSGPQTTCTSWDASEHFVDRLVPVMPQ